MAPYRLSIFFKWQIGLNVNYDCGFINMHIPFIKIMISTSKIAFGVKIFNWDSDEN